MFSGGQSEESQAQHPNVSQASSNEEAAQPFWIGKVTFVDMKAPAFLVRKEGFNPEEIEEGLTIFGPSGCKQCNSGYRGRVGIFQVMEVSETMGRIIMEGGNAMMIADQAEKEGVIDLRRAGLNKVKEGITSLEEVNRVTIE